MPRGPLPTPNARRRNAPTIPTTLLPAAGRKGAAPRVPAGYSFGKPAKAWWSWAWKLPQACGWSAGDLYAIARRASLEDDLAALELVDHFDLSELLGIEDDSEAIRRLEQVLGALKRLAGGRVGVMREMRELDMKLGLIAKGLADLRWTIKDEDPQPAAAPTPKRGERRLHAVDPIAATA
jgi:hypothetical protein